jgi:hypothetical protein
MVIEDMNAGVNEFDIMDDGFRGGAAHLQRLRLNLTYQGLFVAVYQLDPKNPETIGRCEKYNGGLF